jgi:hypothetical protein
MVEASDYSASVWGCFSFDCKLDLYVLDGMVAHATVMLVDSFKT